MLPIATRRSSSKLLKPRNAGALTTGRGFSHESRQDGSIDLLRLRYRDRTLAGEAVNQLAQAPAADSPHRVAEGREIIAQFQEALTRLPADQVEVFCLRYFEQMPNQDIAVQLATSANRVGVLLHRAREALREALKWIPALGSES